jgi:hypothetical protein
MITTQIQLGSNGYLDVSGDVTIPLNFGISDIRDLSARDGSYSKSITLPGSANNRTLLGQLFNVNIVNSSFDLNVKTPCTVIRNGVPTFEGYLQLNSVNKINNDDEVTFNVTLLDDVSNFYSNLGELELIDITYPWDNYNHIYTINNILATSAHTAYNSIYKYHNYENGKQEYNIYDFKPSIWAKRYWDYIFAEAGYQYEWDSLSDFQFDKLIIPFNATSPGPTEERLNLSRLRAGWNTPQNIGILADNNVVNVIWNDDSGSPLFDNGNTYNTSTGVWTSNIDGQINMRIGYNFEVYFINDGPFTVYLTGNTIGVDQYSDAELRIQLRHNIGPNLGLNQTTTYGITNPTIFDFYLNQPVGTTAFVIPPGNVLYASGQSTSEISMVKNVTIGEEIKSWVDSVLDINGNFIRFIGPGVEKIVQGNPNYPRLAIKIGVDAPDYSNNFLIIEPSAILGEGMEVRMSQFIPPNIKQKDFISSITKMFNLYITKDKITPNKLIIKSRDEYYDEGPELDWTSKVNIGEGINIQFLPDLQNKKILLTHKQDLTNLYNKAYTDEFGTIYGEFKYTFENEWVDGEQKIETIFSPAPITNDYAGNAVTSLQTNALRILYDGGLRNGNWLYRSSAGSTKYNFTQYLYAGHFDNPIIPSYDFNFGLPSSIPYDDWTYLTNNNLFNKYYKRFISQIETGKMMTAKFKLEETDILNLDLSSKIWIHDSWWIINKIKDYDVNSNRLTTIELLSVEDGIKFSAQQKSIKKGGMKWNWVPVRISDETKKYSNTYGYGNKSLMVLGDGNQIGDESKSLSVQGDSNQFSGNKLFINGDNNTVQGNGNMVVGTGNTVTGNDIMIFGIDGITADQPGLHYVKSLINYANFISAGRDEVLSPYPSTKVVNYIDAGRDVVRALGSYSIETNINGARNRVI